MKRKIIALALCLALLAVCAVCEAATKALPLGTSAYTLEIPAGYEEGELTEEDIADDMVAYLLSPDSLLDFGVYQFAKEGYADALISALKKLARENYSDLAPSPLLVKLEYIHPPLSQRIAAVEKALQEQTCA